MRSKDEAPSLEGMNEQRAVGKPLALGHLSFSVSWTKVQSVGDLVFY